MDYHLLKSLLAGKTQFQMRSQEPSFNMATKRDKPYIEPSFKKIEFDVERPSVLLVSAVGATGKSALAQVLSHETQLPLLDLAKHKPVADNTISGLLTNAFDVADLTGIFQGLSAGTYGIIIDGIDEGRSKTTDKAFEAFLDDVARRCANSTGTSFVLLGRTQVLEECWVYLTDKNIKTGLITIAPFDLDGARKYIDSFTSGMKSPHAVQYQDTRNRILELLGNAFQGDVAVERNNFLSYIGYPPVLDSIVTLLKDEKNYHRLLETVNSADSSDVEISLLHKITSYILERERKEKVLPNITTLVLSGVPPEIRDSVIKRAYEIIEQSKRLVSYCISKPIALNTIPIPSINERYEEQLASFLPEHPFLNGRSFRNAIFESFAIATLIADNTAFSTELVMEYMATRKYNYHVVYLLSAHAKDNRLPAEAIGIILGSALEFRSTNAIVEFRIDGPGPADVLLPDDQETPIEIEIEILLEKGRNRSKTFVLQSSVTSSSHVKLGPRLSGAFICLPCNIVIAGMSEIEITSPVEITARGIDFQSKELILRNAPHDSEKLPVVVEAVAVSSTLENIVTNGVSFSIIVSDHGNLTYPVINYVQRQDELPNDGLITEKYMRLRRILMQFRSHSKGSLAKFKDKIDCERIMRDDTAYAVRDRLLRDGVLSLQGKFYHLHPEKIDQYLGVSYIDLRKGRSSEALFSYLRGIA
jgi:hypothetical protein